MSDLSRRERAAQNAAHRDMEAALAHAPTRTVFRALIAVSGVFDDVTGKRAEGQRSVGLWLINEMSKVDHQSFPRLMQEAANERLKHKANQEIDDV